MRGYDLRYELRGRGFLILGCWTGAYFYGRYPTGSVAASQSDPACGFLRSFLRAYATERRDGPKTMTLRRADLAARRRGELNNDRGSRRVSWAIDAKRRLNALRADRTAPTADRAGPRVSGRQATHRREPF
jgi:hypothetical protein